MVGAFRGGYIAVDEFSKSDFVKEKGNVDYVYTL